MIWLVMQQHIELNVKKLCMSKNERFKGSKHNQRIKDKLHANIIQIIKL